LVSGGFVRDRAPRTSVDSTVCAASAQTPTSSTVLILTVVGLALRRETFTTSTLPNQLPHSSCWLIALVGAGGGSAPGRRLVLAATGREGAASGAKVARRHGKSS
jgi:hypothetical protein